MRGYLQVLRLPGAGRMALAGAISRFPNAMQGIAIVLLIRALYKDWELAGLASGAMTISCAVCAPTVARLVDRFGQSRVGYPVIGAYCVIAASLVICALTHRPRPVLLGIALLFGACQFPVGAMTRARWTRLAGQGKSLQLSFSFESAVDDVAFMFGPTFATMLITAIHPAAGLIAAILLLVLGGSFFLSGRATEPPVRSRSEPAVGPSALRTPGVATVAAVFIAMGMGFGVSGIAVPALCDEWGHGWAPGLVLGLGSTASCLGAAFYGARSWRSPLWQRFVACVALQVGPSCLFLLAGNLPVLMVYSFLSGITISPSFINGNALVQRMVEPSRLTEGLAWISTAMMVGSAAGSALAGVVAERYGGHSAYWITACGAIAGLIVTFASIPTVRRQTEPRTLPLSGNTEGGPGVTGVTGDGSGG